MLDTNYSIKNALNYDMFCDHCKEVMNINRSISYKMGHAFVAILEFPPIIGQIIALFELAITKAFSVSDKKVYNTTTEKANSLLYSFYQGKGRDIENRTLAEIWAFSDNQKESAHDYIQWLFPSQQGSQFNPYAPVLGSAKSSDGKTSLLEELRNDKIVIANLRKSFDVMLKFYGLHIDQNDKKIHKNSNFDQRAKVWLTSGNHNFLRISRILACLRNFGLNDEAAAFINMLREIKSTDNTQAISHSNFSQWETAAASKSSPIGTIASIIGIALAMLAILSGTLLYYSRAI